MKGSLNISAHLLMKIILLNPNFLVTTFFILIMMRTLENNYFLVRTKFGYLQYYLEIFTY